MSGKRLTRWAIAGVVALSVALTIQVGSVAGIDYDGWWHLFVARQESGARFLAEIRANPHPPLYHLLLRATSALGSERLAYRLVGIAATAGSVLLVGRIAEQLFRSRAMIVLATLVFGTSITTVGMANELRSYALAGMFVLAALLAYFRMLFASDPPGRSSILLAASLALGVLSHYGVLLLLPILAIVPALLPGAAKQPFARLLGALAPAAGLGLLMLVLHGNAFREPMVYMAQHYYSGSEPLWGYLGRAAQSELNLLSPVPLDALPAAAQAIALAVVAGGTLALFSRLRTRGERAPAALLLVFVGLVAATALASVIGRYPFGGLLRHQYFVFLLGFLACFLLLDHGVAAIASARHRTACVALLWLLSLATGIVRWQALEIDALDRPAEQYRRVLKHLPRESEILVRRTSLINAFAHHHRSRWHFVEQIPGTQLEEWRIETGTQDVVLYRRLGGWLLLLDDPETYRDARALLEARGGAAITTVEVRHGAAWNRSGWTDPSQSLEAIRRLARQHQLSISNVRVNVQHSIARFQLETSPAQRR